MRKAILQREYDRKVSDLARDIKNKYMRVGQFFPPQEAQRQLHGKYFIVKNSHHLGMSEYEYLVEQAVENGESWIVYQGRTIPIT